MPSTPVEPRPTPPTLPTPPAPTEPARLPLHLEGDAVTTARAERTQPNLLLLVCLFLSLVLTGGLMAWLRAGSSIPKHVEVAESPLSPGPAATRGPLGENSGRSTPAVAEEPVLVELRPASSTPRRADVARAPDTVPGTTVRTAQAVLSTPRGADVPRPRDAIPMTTVLPAEPGRTAPTPSRADVPRPPAPVVPRTAAFPVELVPALVRPGPSKAPEREVGPARVLRPPVTTPASKRPAVPEVLHLRAQFTLEGGGDPASIRVEVHQDGRCESLATLTTGSDGRVCVEVPARTDYLLVATAPGHAFTLHHVDLGDGERGTDAPVLLARELEYVIDVVDLDLAPREVETRRVRAGQLLHDLRFTQEGAALHATPTRGPCVARAVEGPLERLKGVTALEGTDTPCDFGLEPEAVFSVKQGNRWFAVRLREPGHPAPQLDGPRRVIRGLARR